MIKSTKPFSTLQKKACFDNSYNQIRENKRDFGPFSGESEITVNSIVNNLFMEIYKKSIDSTINFQNDFNNYLLGETNNDYGQKM